MTEGYMPSRGHSICDCAGHIVWTVDKSADAYAYSRDALKDLRQALVNAELKYQEQKRKRPHG